MRSGCHGFGGLWFGALALSLAFAMPAAAQGPLFGGPQPGPQPQPAPQPQPQGPVWGQQPSTPQAPRPGAYLGQWECEFAFTQNDQQGARVSGHTRSFWMTLAQDGTYQAQGTVMGIDGQNQFQSQGQWQVESDMIMLRGTEVTSSPFDMGGMPFLYGTYYSNELDVFHYGHEVTNEDKTIIFNRTMSYCMRPGAAPPQ